MLIVAWYFVVLVYQPEYQLEVPLLIGPYHTRQMCVDIEVRVSREGYTTETCTIMSTAQDSVYIEPEE